MMINHLKGKTRIIAHWLVICLVMSGIGAGCSLLPKKENTGYVPPTSEVEESTEEPETTGMSEEDASYAAQDCLAAMTLEEKVGQMFMVNLEQLDRSKGDFFEFQKVTKEMRESLKNYAVGGVILFSRNITKRKQTRKLIRRLQANASRPLFISVDEEGGDVARIGKNPDMKTDVFPTMEEIGKTKDADYVYHMAGTIGEQIKELGFNVDLAPVADVRTSDLNEEIGSRSFGDDPQKVAKLVSAYVKGLKSQNVCATLKHFPGQGSSTGDTHQGSVDIDSSIAGLRKTDFVPFVEGIEAGADFIMVSHISVSRVTETSEPASLSELIMTTILREELGYEGLIITDAFDMACITDDYTPEEAAIAAFEAGADVILMPKDLGAAYGAIMDKVSGEEGARKKLDDIVLRILKLKFMKGIMTLEDIQALGATAQP